MDQTWILHNFNKFKMCLTWNRWNIIIFLFLLLQGGGHFWKKTCQNGWCARLFEATHWQLLASFRYVHGVAEMHYNSATTKAKRVFSFSTCHIGPNEWINNIVVPSFTIRCSGLCPAHWSRFQIFCLNTTAWTVNDVFVDPHPFLFWSIHTILMQ